MIPSFYPAVVYGGTIFSSLNTCRALTKLGYDVRVSTTNTNMHDHLSVPRNQLMEIAPGLRVKYYHDTLVDRFSLPLFRGVAADLAAADLVHVQAIFNSPTPWALHHARRLGKPVVLSPRGVLGDWIMDQGLPFKRWWLRCFIEPFATYVHWHATAEQEREEILRWYPGA
ncbi:MAG: glycosyltransferase, partial [Catalinimonas sp.]